MAKTRNAAEPLSSICLIRLWLSTVNRPATLRTRENEKDESDPPPKNRGVALVLIYPCGKAWNSPPFPSRFIVSDRSSPSRVRFAASRPGRLRADPKDALLTREKGGVGPWGAERGIFPNGRRIDGTRRYRGNGIGREQSSER